MNTNRSLSRSRGLAIAAAALALFALAGCGDSPESRRKQAQSNADKYWELLKANNARGAYDQTLSATYKADLNPEAFLRFNDGIFKAAGPILSFQVVHYDAPKDRPIVTLTYAVQASNTPDALLFDIQCSPEGSDWRISQVEPKIQRPNQGPPTGQTPSQSLPQRAPGSTPASPAAPGNAKK